MNAPLRLVAPPSPAAALATALARARLAALALVAALVALTGLMAPAAATAAAPPPPALPEIRFEKYELPNGLDVILHEDHTLPVVTVNVWYHVGSKNEKRGRTGFAHLFEHMMFQGSQHHDDEFFRPIEEAGGDVNGSTNEDRTNYWENVPSNYLELALWLEADRMGYLLPAMTQEKLDNQRDVVKNERRQGLDNEPYAKAEELMLSLLFPPDHPYSWSVIGSMEDLSAASLEDVSNFFRTYYTPNNASLCIAGDFDPAAAKKLVETHFGSIPPGPAIDRVEAWTPPLAGVKRAVAEDNVKLPRVYMAWHAPAAFAPGDAEMDLLAEVLAGGKTSRLYRALVYERQIAQDVDATQYSNEIGSSFVVQVTAREGHTIEEVEAATDDEIARLLAKGVAEPEIANAKAAYEARFVRRLERVGGFGGRADELNSYNTMLGDPGGFERDLARYRKATRADLLAAARRWLDMDARAILHIVPQGDRAAKESTVDLARKPSPGPERAFTPPSFQRARLANGLDLLVVEDHRLPIVQLNVVVRGGWSADPPGHAGTAALTADLLDEGTKSRSALEISDAFERIGARFSTTSQFDACSARLNVLTRHLDEGLALMADVVLHPTFPAEELERKRGIYLGRIQQETKEPVTSAIRAFGRTLYGPDHPYGQPYTGSGTTESVQAATRDDLVAYYAENFHPNNAAVVVVGDITLDEARARVEAAFREWRPGPEPRHEPPAPPAIRATRICLIDKPGAPQSVIVAGHLGIRRADPDYAACRVMNGCFGGQFMSRLNMNLREGKGYTYGAWSFFWEARGVGSFAMYAPVQTPSTKDAVSEMVKEMRDVQAGRPLTDEEVAQSRNSLVRGYPQGFETCDGIADKLEEIVVYDLPEDEWVRYTHDVSAIDTARATEAARKHLHPDALLIVVVGDRKAIEPGLRELGLGEIEVVEAKDL